MLRWNVAILASACLAAWSGIARAQTPNMDAGLASIVRDFKAGRDPRTQAAAPFSFQPLARRDAQGRVLVEVRLDGAVSFDRFRETLLSLGAAITGENSGYSKGAFSAWVPPGMMEALARSTGLNNVSLSYRPVLNAGLVTSQGAKVMGSDVVNTGGLTGAGITVGVLSDSFGTATAPKTTAAGDVSTGDLPAMKWVSDLGSAGTDEGRAMAQIVRDVAPGASLCFATAFNGNTSFAANIRALRTNTACAADVIVDDVTYFDEPFFADGQIAQAVDDVATSTILPGKKVTYLSSAGNFQKGAFLASPAKFVPMPASITGIDMASIAVCAPGLDTGGGVLDFGGGSVTSTLTAYSMSYFILQWDDPFDRVPSGITTDLSLLFFSPSTGKCLGRIDADNFATNQPIELLSVSGVLKVLVARKGKGSRLATRVKLVAPGAAWTPVNRSAPAIFGQSGATHAISVGAYSYTSAPSQQSPFIPVFEPFSSPGPMTISIDKSGNRLSIPITRYKPEISAPDGVDTTFFGTDWESNGYPNFFGTSAAAPHAAGVAALVLQKAGGPGTLTPVQVRGVLQNSTRARAIPYSTSTALSNAWSPFDGTGLLDAGKAARRAVNVTLSINPTSLAAGGTATVNITVKPVSGTGVPSGSIDLMTASGALVQTFPLSAGAVNSTTTQLPANSGIFVSATTLKFPPYPVIARYRGDVAFAGGDSPAVTVNVNYVLPPPPPCCLPN